MNLIGKKLNYLTIISNEIKKENDKKYYFCKCECGNEKWILKSSFDTKRIRDCGCGNFMLKKHIGEEYNSYKVIDCYRKRYSGRVNIVAICQCQKCGRIKQSQISELKRTKNENSFCICYRNEKTKEKYLNKTFNGILVLGFVEGSKNKKVKCMCHCGEIFITKPSFLIKEKEPIIGCSKCRKQERKTNSKKSTKIKSKNDKLRSIYYNMKDRCYNKNAKDYKWYGKIGIKVCDFWLEDYKNFEKWSFENGYGDKLTLDRIDFNGNYEPNNCRWVDMITQQNNKRNNVKYDYKNEKLTLSEIARKENVNVHTLRTRIRCGMTLEDSLKKPIRKKTVNKKEKQ